MNTVKDQINVQLITLFRDFYGANYVLPEGLSIENVGEHIYGTLNDLPSLQDIFLNLLNEGVQSPHFLNAIEFVLDFVT